MNFARPHLLTAALCGALLLLSIGNAEAVKPYHYPSKKLNREPLQGGYSWTPKNLQRDRATPYRIDRESNVTRYARPRKSNRVSR